MTPEEFTHVLETRIQEKYPTAYISFMINFGEAFWIAVSEEGGQFVVDLATKKYPVTNLPRHCWSFNVFFDEPFSFRSYGSTKLLGQTVMNANRDFVQTTSEAMLCQVAEVAKRFPV